MEGSWKIVERYGLPALTVLIIVVVAMAIARVASRFVVASCKKAKIEETLVKFFAKLTRVAILLVAALFCLDKFGIETSSFAVVLGSLGLAAGLALQGTLANFASGVMLLIFRPFKVGDVVSVGGQTGKIFAIELFSTILDTADNRRIVLPNGSVFGQTIENVTFHDVRRVEVSVGVDYGADLDRTRQVLQQAAAEVPGGLADPAPQVVLSALADSSVHWTVRIWCPTADYWAVHDATIRAVKMTLDRAEIAIPFPQLEIRTKTA